MDLRQFIAGRDEIDREIISYRLLEMTMREIGDLVGMSHVAVSKRLQKIQRDLRKLID